MGAADDEHTTKQYSVIENIRYLTKHTMKCCAYLLLWCAITVVARAFLPVLTTYLPKLVIHAITERDLRALIINVCACMAGIALMSSARLFFEKVIFHQRFRVNTYFVSEIARKGLTTDYQNQENEHFRKLQSESFSACNGNLSPLASVYDIWIELAASEVGLTVFLGLLAKVHILLLLFLIATTVIGYFVNNAVLRWVKAHEAERIGYQQRTNYIKNASGDARAAKDIRLYAMKCWFADVYFANMKGLSNWYRAYAKKLFGVSLADGGLTLLSEGAAYAYLLSLVLGGKMSVSDFVLYIGVVTGFSAWLKAILSQLGKLRSVNLPINSLRAYLEYAEHYRREGGISTKSMMRAPEKIELAHVYYRYEGADNDTLKDISLTLSPGERLAIVGLNGAGKTTLVKLLCGLTEPTRGHVRYGKEDVRAYNRTEYYKLFSAVFQQFSLLPACIDEIVAEAPSDALDKDRVANCIRRAGLSEVISALPDGARSEYGKAIYDGGVEFSGGEVQKLLLARALYKDAPVILLDEPTAALDPIAENKLYETYHEIMRGKSCVFISHRLASTRFCDRILLIEDGEICEEGTHQSLLEKKGKYYTLFETQAKYYREQAQGGEASV